MIILLGIIGVFIVSCFLAVIDEEYKRWRAKRDNRRD